VVAKPKKIRWQSLVGFIAKVNRKGSDRVLAINTISPDGETWIAQAIETAKDANSIEAVYGDHGHHSLGEFDSLDEAKAECLHYAMHWREGKDAPGTCDCEEIANEIERELDLSETALERDTLAALEVVQKHGRRRTRVELGAGIRDPEPPPELDPATMGDPDTQDVIQTADGPKLVPKLS